MSTKRRRAKRTVELNLRQQIGYRRASRCGNCEFCKPRFYTRAKAPKRKVDESIATRGRHKQRPKKMFRVGGARGDIRPWCDLTEAWVKKDHVCLYHLPSSMPYREKHIQKALVNPRDGVKFARQELALALEEKKHYQRSVGRNYKYPGLPRFPNNPTYMKMQGYIPADIRDYVDEHWDLVLADYLNYRIAQYNFLCRYIDSMSHLIRSPENYIAWRDKYELAPGSSFSEAVIAYLKDHGITQAQLDYFYTRQELQRIGVPGIKVPKLALTWEKTLLSPQENQAEGDGPPRIPLRQDEAEREEEGGSGQ